MSFVLVTYRTTSAMIAGTMNPDAVSPNTEKMYLGTARAALEKKFWKTILQIHTTRHRTVNAAPKAKA